MFDLRGCSCNTLLPFKLQAAVQIRPQQLGSCLTFTHTTGFLLQLTWRWRDGIAFERVTLVAPCQTPAQKVRHISLWRVSPDKKTLRSRCPFALSARKEMAKKPKASPLEWVNKQQTHTVRAAYSCRLALFAGSPVRRQGQNNPC